MSKPPWALRLVTESGEPKEIERRWNSAPFFCEEDDSEPPENWVKFHYLEDNRDYEVSEFELHYQMLDEMLEHEFGVCPWKTDVEPIFCFFKVNQN